MILSCLGLKVLVPSKALEEAGNASGRPGLRGAAGSFSASRRRGRRGSNLTELGLWAEHPSWNKAYGEQKDLHHSQSIPNMWIPGCFEVYSIYSSGLKLRMTFVPFVRIIFGTFCLQNTAPVQETKLSMPPKLRILSSRGVLKESSNTIHFFQRAKQLRSSANFTQCLLKNMRRGLLMLECLWANLRFFQKQS